MTWRTKKAFSFAEVAASSFIVVFLAIMTVDICLLVFGCSVNDKACRDATRTAAQATNSAQALTLAQGSVLNHKTDGFFIGTIMLDATKFQFQEYGGTPPAGACPFVSVSTFCTVTLPCPLYFFGPGFTNSITFRQIYTSPIVKTKYILP